MRQSAPYGCSWRARVRRGDRPARCWSAGPADGAAPAVRTPARHDVPRVPRGQLLERRHLQAARRLALRRLARRTCTRRAACTPTSGRRYGDLPVPYGIPITIVSGTHAKFSVSFTYASESDKVKYPLGSDTKIEGGSRASGDRHAIVVDKTTCRVYETWLTTKPSTGGWKAGSGATWSLTSNALRPAGWTSADAAGLPILPGLLRLDEVKAGLRRPRDPLHHRRHRRLIRLAGAARRRGPCRQRRTRRWAPGSGSRRRTRPPGSPRGHQGRHQGDEAVRPGARGQRLVLVLPGDLGARAGRRRCSTSSSRSRRRRSRRSTRRR